MSAPYFYITDGTTTISLDDTVSQLTLGGNTRAFNVIEYAGSHGGFITGIGNYSPKKFKVTRREYATGSNVNAWNARRNAFMAMATKAYFTPVYLYLQDGEETVVLRTRIYCTDIDGDKYEYIKVSDKRDFTFISSAGFYENTSVTTDTEAITTGAEQTISITNSGNIECPLICKFTPTGNETIFQAYIYNNYGFRLEGNFKAGILVAYNTETSEMTIGGVSVNSEQYLTAGDVFEIPTGTVNLYVGASGPCEFTYDFYGRYI